MNNFTQNEYLLEKRERVWHETMEVHLVNVKHGLGSLEDVGPLIYAVGVGSTGSWATDEIKWGVESSRVKVRAFDSAPFLSDKYQHLSPETEFVQMEAPDSEVVLRNLELHPALMERTPSIASNIRDRLAVLNNGAGGSRKAGFFLFYRNVEKIRATLISDIAEIRKGKEDKHLMVIVIGTTTGGTASSQMVEFGYLIQSILESMGVDDYSTVISPILPISEEEPSSGGQLVIKGKANAFKFWQELGHFMSCGEFEMRYCPSIHVKSNRRPFDMIFPIEGGSLEEAVCQVVLLMKGLTDGNQLQSFLARLQDKKDILIDGQIVGQPLCCVAVAEASLVFDPTPILKQWACEFGHTILERLLSFGDAIDMAEQAKSFLQQHSLTAQDMTLNLKESLVPPNFSPSFRYNAQLPTKIKEWITKSKQETSFEPPNMVLDLVATFKTSLKAKVDELVNNGKFQEARSFLITQAEELQGEIDAVCEQKEIQINVEKSIPEEELNNAIEEISKIVTSIGYFIPVVRNILMSKVVRLTQGIIDKVRKQREARWKVNVCDTVRGILDTVLKEIQSLQKNVNNLLDRAQKLDDALTAIERSQKVSQANRENEEFIQLSEAMLSKVKPSLDTTNLVLEIVQKMKDWSNDDALAKFMAWCIGHFDILARYTLVHILAEEAHDGFEPAVEVKRLIKSAKPTWHYTTGHMESQPPQICIASVGRVPDDKANQNVRALLRLFFAENCIAQGRDPNRLDVSVYIVGLPPAAWNGIDECQKAYNEANRQGDESFHIFGNRVFESPIPQVDIYSRRAKKVYEDGLRLGLLTNTGEYRYRNFDLGRSVEQVIASLIRNQIIMRDLESEIAQSGLDNK